MYVKTPTLFSKFNKIHIINYPTSGQKQNTFKYQPSLFLSLDQPIYHSPKQLKKKKSLFRCFQHRAELTFTVRRHTGHILAAGNLDTPR